MTILIEMLEIILTPKILGPRNRGSLGIGVREGILLGGRKKFALKLTICPKNRQLALKLTF